MLDSSVRMTLPLVSGVCGCRLELGCVILTLLSMLACAAEIAAGARRLPWHRERMPEDNLISMSMVMFSTLSFISNVFILMGMGMRRPGYVQFAQLFNSLFVLFLFLVGVVTCLFSPEVEPYLQSPLYVALVVVAMVAGAAFCFYNLVVVNSVYRKMKMRYDSAIPV